MDYLTIKVGGKGKNCRNKHEVEVVTSGGNAFDEIEKVSCPYMIEKGSRHMSGEGPEVEKLSVSHHVWESVNRLLVAHSLVPSFSFSTSAFIHIPSEATQGKIFYSGCFCDEGQVILFHPC